MTFSPPSCLAFYHDYFGGKTHFSGHTLHICNGRFRNTVTRWMASFSRLRPALPGCPCEGSHWSRRGGGTQLHPPLGSSAPRALDLHLGAEQDEPETTFKHLRFPKRLLREVVFKPVAFLVQQTTIITDCLSVLRYYDGPVTLQGSPNVSELTQHPHSLSIIHLLYDGGN